MLMPATTEERVATLEAGHAELKDDITGIMKDIRSIRDQLAGRPTWAVTMMLTLLTSTCGVLATALIAALN